MTDDPRVWCAAILTLLVVVLTASIGCTGLDYVPNHDIVVLKLTPDGSLEWTKVIDHGFDDAGKDLIELPAGGYAIAGQTSYRRIGQPRSVLSPPQPLLIRLSPEGADVWDRSVTDGFDVANAVVSEGDGGTAVLTGNGTVVRFDPAGRTLWSRATGIPEAFALISTADGGYLAGGRIMYEVPVNDTAGPGSVVRLPVITTETGAVGPVLVEAAGQPTTPQIARIPRRFDHVRKAMVVKLGADGAVDWERQYDDGGLNWLESLAGSLDGTGFVVAGHGDALNGSTNIANPLLILHLAPDGTPGPVTQVDYANVGDPLWIQSEGAGFRMLYLNTTEHPTAEGFHDWHVVAAALDRDGSVLERHPVEASIAVTLTGDGGYFSVGTPPVRNGSSYDTETNGLAGGETFHARRLDRAGALIWDRPLPGVPCDRVLKVVQTADGGYAVLGQRQNR